MRFGPLLSVAFLLSISLITFPARSVAQQDDLERNNGNFPLSIGVSLFLGKGVPKDLVMAARYIRMAADQGNADAQNLLGTMFKAGEGVEKDNHEAAKLFRKAANNGHAEAQNNLGMLYTSGHGVPQDYLESIKWYRLSANQGSPNAQHNLGVAFNHGLGVSKNHIVAYALFNLASANKTGDDRAVVAGRTLTASRLTRTEILEAQALTRRMSETGKLIATLDEYINRPKSK